MTLGYLVPEFPGQTHVLFWRELAELRKRNVSVEVASTRRPLGAQAHEWTKDAAAETTYIYPPSLSLVAAAVSTVIRCGPTGITRWYRTLRASDGLNVPRSTAHMFALAISGALLAGLARRRNWTHVHVHSCGDAANIALFASSLTGLTYSVTLHGSVADYGGNQRQKWRHASFAIVITNTLAAEVERLSLASPGQSVRVVSMGVDPSVFRRTTPYQPWRAGKQLRLFSCARLNEAKGHIDVLKALEAIRASGLEAVLVIAGEDEFGGREYRRTVEQYIDDAGLTEAVELLGAVNETRVRRELERAHIFVLASRAEPLGVAIMEAMAMEIPVIVTGGGGVSELVADGVSGVLIPPASPQHIAGAIKKLLLEPERACSLGRNGRTTVIDQFDVARSAEVLVEELTKVRNFTQPWRG